MLGGVAIGEAGAQALKALQEEGIETILMTPNVTTVQTSDEFASTTYLLPVTTDYVEQVL